MSEGFARHFGHETFTVQSAGVSPAGIHPMTIQMMKEEGIDLSGQWSKSIDDIELGEVDYIVTVCGNAKSLCPTLPKKLRGEHWDIPDPIGFVGTDADRAERFRQVRNDLKSRIQKLLTRLLNEPE